MEGSSEADGGEEVQPLIEESQTDIKLENYRWLILVLYSAALFVNLGAWLCLYTITDATAKFYNVPAKSLFWVFNAATLLQVIVGVPASFLPSRAGLRPTMCASVIINALGAVFLAAASSRDGFAFFAAGQIILGIAGCVLPQLAPEVAAVWFGVDERATATSVAVVVSKFGAAIGFLQPALLVGNTNINENFGAVAENIRVVVYSQAALCLVLLILVVIFFRERPRSPPSYSQAHHRGVGNITFTEFMTSIKLLLKDPNYHLACHAYALASTLFSVVPVTLNQMISWKMPNHDATVGWIGCSATIVGTVSSIVVGVVLDKTRQYKRIVLTLAAISVVAWTAYSCAIGLLANITLAFILFDVTMVVFFPIEPVVVDMMAEITYPISPGISYVISIVFGRIYIIVFVALASWFIDQKKQYAVCAMVLVGALIILISLTLVKVHRRRTMADESLVSLKLEASDFAEGQEK